MGMGEPTALPLPPSFQAGRVVVLVEELTGWGQEALPPDWC